MATVATVKINLQFNGLAEATREIRRFRQELKKLDGAKARVTVSIDGLGESIATKPMVVDRNFVNRTLTPGMQLNPSMLAPYIANGRILPDKQMMFVESINRELLREHTKHRGAKTVLRTRKQFIEQYGVEFLYFKSPIGKPLNKVASNMINQSIFK